MSRQILPPLVIITGDPRGGEFDIYLDTSRSCIEWQNYIVNTINLGLLIYTFINTVVCGLMLAEALIDNQTWCAR